MATGPEHYLEAQKLLLAADNESDPAWVQATATRAQAHATLALAAATALNDADGGMVSSDYEAWRAVAGEPEWREVLS